MVSLDWEEGIFRGLYSLWQRARTRPQTHEGISLDELNERIQTVSQLIAGRPLLVRAAEGVGGIRGPVLLLPASLSVAPNPSDNLTLYLLRTLINSTMIENWGDEPPELVGLAGRIRYLFAVRQAHRQLCETFPNYAEIYHQALSWECQHRPCCDDLSPIAAALEKVRLDLARGVDLDQNHLLQRFRGLEEPDTPGFLLWGETLSAGDIQTAEIAAREAKEHQQTADGTEFESPPRDFVSLTILEQVDEVPPLPLHTFEKTETLDTYKGGIRQVDGDDELEEHQEALKELDLREVIRGGRETRGFYKADVDLGTAVPEIHHVEPGEKGILYPEWHYKTRRYRKDWVTVYPSTIRGSQLQQAHSIVAAHRGQILQLRNRLLKHRSRYDRCTRQNQGTELDMEAIVNAYGDRRAGLDPGEKLYISQRKRQRDTAITLLFDVSLSSGSWIDGYRILDVTRKAVLILGEVAESLGDTLRVLAFASNTRNHCRVWEVKAWTESWKASLGRVCAIEPQGYTRIGPALRHAVTGFDQVTARSKGLLIITDGKPTDYDRYEGNYGRQDVHMAIHEGRERGIQTHALALDPGARRTLPAMFGVSGWQVVRQPAELAEALVTAYGRIHDG